MSAIVWADLSPRERDALVGERVMGKRYWLQQRGEFRLAVWSDAEWEPGKRHRAPANEAERHTATDALTAARTGFYGEHPRYTTDIAAAWEVVEKMRETDDNMIPCIAWSVFGYWIAGFVFGGIADAKAATAPEAIAIAALRACGVEVLT
jgi:hypothetical protein